MQGMILDWVKRQLKEALEKDLELEFMPSEARMDGGDVLQIWNKFFGRAQQQN